MFGTKRKLERLQENIWTIKHDLKSIRKDIRSMSYDLKDFHGAKPSEKDYNRISGLSDEATEKMLDIIREDLGLEEGTTVYSIMPPNEVYWHKKPEERE